MSLHDPMCLMVIWRVRETTVRMNTVFWPLMYNVSCTRDITHTWVIATSELSSNIESIVKKKKKLCILHCSLLSVELRNEVFHVNLMPWDKFGEKYENALILHSITCCSLLQSNLV